MSDNSKDNPPSNNLMLPMALAIRKSPQFEAPVIFLSEKDAAAFLEVTKKKKKKTKAEPPAAAIAAAGAAVVPEEESNDGTNDGNAVVGGSTTDPDAAAAGGGEVEKSDEGIVGDNNEGPSTTAGGGGGGGATADAAEAPTPADTPNNDDTGNNGEEKVGACDEDEDHDDIIEYETFEDGLQDSRLYEYVLENYNGGCGDDDGGDGDDVKRRGKKRSVGRPSKRSRKSAPAAMNRRGRKRKSGDDDDEDHLVEDVKPDIVGSIDGRKQHLQRHMLNFDKDFARLRKFKEEYGDTDVPVKKALYRTGPNNDKIINQDSKDVKGLGTWVKSIRGQLKIFENDPTNSLLTKGQVTKLQEIGFTMEPKRGVNRKTHELQPCWDETKYEELVEYHTANGHCNVPKKPKSDLRTWLDRVRLAYQDLKDGVVATITDEEITKLDALGIDWSEKRKYTFAENFEKWKQYKMENNGKDPPFGHPVNKWVTSIRTAYSQFVKGEKKGGLTHEQVKELTEAGFLFGSRFENAPDLNSRSFSENFEKWCEYKCQNPEGKDPPKGSKIHDWMQRMRSAYLSYCKGEKGRYVITQKQVNILKVAGFYFPSEAKPNKPPVRRTHARNLTFDERLEELRAYKEKYGDCMVPNRYPSLGEFVKQTRKEYKKWNVPGKRSSMNDERYAKLVEIGFCFDATQNKGGGGSHHRHANDPNMAAVHQVAAAHNHLEGGGDPTGGVPAALAAQGNDPVDAAAVVNAAAAMAHHHDAQQAAYVQQQHHHQLQQQQIPHQQYHQHHQAAAVARTAVAGYGSPEVQRTYAGMKRKTMDSPHHNPYGGGGGGHQQQHHLPPTHHHPGGHHPPPHHAGGEEEDTNSEGDVHQNYEYI